MPIPRLLGTSIKLSGSSANSDLAQLQQLPRAATTSPDSALKQGVHATHRGPSNRLPLLVVEACCGIVALGTAGCIGFFAVSPSAWGVLRIN